MTTPAVQAVGLGVRRGRSEVLHDCRFRIPRGAVCGLVGPNGAGKSVLLATAAGLVAPDSGRLELLGRPVGDAANRPRIAYVDQNRSLYRQFSVQRLLRLGRDLNPGWRPDAAEEVLDAARIPVRARAGSLSGGQRTLVSLALARGKAADVLLLDEPLSDLDPLARRRTMGLLLADVAERGATLLLSSHVLADLEESIDHLLLLDHGRVRLAGPLPELLAAHRLPDPLSVPAARSAGVGAPAGSVPARAHRVDLLPGDAGPDHTEAPTLEELVLAYLHHPGAPDWISPAMRPLTPETCEAVGA
nr:ABC transporter ATP-binding protein [Streptacidiphilus anmyonensis]